MMRFDQALPTLVRLCEDYAGWDEHVERACVARDLLGRLRLALKLKTAGDPLLVLEKLDRRLKEGLGDYFQGPILDTSSRRTDEARLAAKLLELSQDWAPRYEDPFTGSIKEPVAGRWRKLERRLAKQAWLEDDRRAEPPWQLGDGPPIVTFYSFKGGVGRTTALASCAWQLARRGRRVAVLDLDLEGPGVGTLLAAETGHGVLDFLVDFLATESRDLDGLVSPARALDDEAERVDVLPAGVLGLEYLEKLGRLDFQSSVAGDEKSPIDRALQALLQAVKGHVQPDYLFLDARSGLHDLSGMSLHGLAHLDVLFCRAAEQSYAGLDLTVRALSRRRSPDDLLAVVVHAFAPTDSRVYEDEVQEVLERTYDVFCEHVYGEDPPALEARDAPHSPRVLRANPALERFSQLSGVEHHLLADDYRGLLDRIVELSEAPGEEER